MGPCMANTMVGIVYWNRRQPIITTLEAGTGQCLLCWHLIAAGQKTTEIMVDADIAIKNKELSV